MCFLHWLSGSENEVLFAFSVAPGKANFLTAMLLISYLVLLIYILYKSSEINGMFITH